MSAFNLQLKPSPAARKALLALSLLPALQLWLMPVQGLWWWLLALSLPLYFWQGYQLFMQLGVTEQLVIAPDNQLHWFTAEQRQADQHKAVQQKTAQQEPAQQAARHGQLLPGGRVSEWFIQLCWQQHTPSKPKRCYCWIVADQCSEAEYRTLARIVTQLNWQRSSQQR